jgi:hypothetical protein
VLVLPRAAVGQAPAAPRPPDDTQSIRVGTVVFYDYTHTQMPRTTDAAGNQVAGSAFNVARAYLNVTGAISHVVSFRVTPDVARETGTGSSLQGSLTLRLKYAYAQFALDDWLPRGTFVRAGLQQTLFIDSQEGVYRYRFQGTVFAERDGGLSSADFGISVRTPLPNDYGDVQAAVYNGEGYNRTEPNDQKSLQVRATVRPAPGHARLRGLRVTGFYLADHVVRDAVRHRAIASATFEHARFNAGVDYLRRRDQTTATTPVVSSEGFSLFVTPFFAEKGRGLEGLFRWDTFRPDVDLGGRQRRLIAGLAYWFPHPGGAATAAILLDVEQVTFRDLDQPRQQRVTLHGLINF